MKILSCLAAFALMVTVNYPATVGAQPTMKTSTNQDGRFFELRTYHAAQGKLDELNARFRNHTLAIFAKHNMTSIGYWVPVENTDNVLIYLLAYPSREARGQSWKEFGADPEWQAVQHASEANGKLVDHVDSVFLTATDFSPMVQPSAGDATRLFELRTYHAAPDKLDDLLARFRDHTCALFDKHGLAQIGYFVPTEKKDGAGETLIYILAHKDKDGAAAAWKAFRDDPDWVKAKADSEKNGALTVQNGVKSVYMAPMDYSPMK